MSHYANRFAVLVDACCLAGAIKRNMILSLAEAGYFRINWSERILDEAGRAISRITEKHANVEKQLNSMRVAFPEASVEGYETLEQTIAEGMKGFCRKVFTSSQMCHNTDDRKHGDGISTMVDFKGAHFPKSVILHAVFFYVRYPVSYRDLQEILAERGISVDHATLNRWVVRYSPQIATQAVMRKRPTASSWRVDETYIKVRGKWTFLYRAVDRAGQTLDSMLSERRDLAAARRFFKKAITTNGVPEKVVIDKSDANLAGLQAVNTILKFIGAGAMIEIRQVKYLNNILEQDHRFIKRITKPMMGFKAFHSASATIAGIEVAHMIRKNQFANDNRSPFQVFAELAA